MIKVVIFLFIGLVITLMMQPHLPKIDLPEEYQLISHDSTHPEQLVGYYDKDNVLHIGFKH